MASPVVVAAASVGRRRTCPQCGHRQLVALFLRTQAVPCHRCAAAIPPAPAKPRVR